MPSPEELLAAAQALASFAEDRGLHDKHILPTMGEWKVAARIAAATGMKAQEQGLAAVSLRKTDLYRGALERIQAARRAAGLLFPEPAIAPAAAI